MTPDYVDDILLQNEVVKPFEDLLIMLNQHHEKVKWSLRRMMSWLFTTLASELWRIPIVESQFLHKANLKDKSWKT